ncbi:hypothetical protein [Cobetia sp. QF-1]|uniref:hypothetical protein n=1 Tax=Cobetia sp. QF-1 TaxID=1969833 RepID=UPI000B53DE6D|nr:hypothetical protein [Cobetia sp. QF-1]
MSIIKDAAVAYRDGKYSEAVELYKEAGKYYGENLFYANIILCNRAMQNDKIKGSYSYIPISEDINIIKQLSESQTLLEYYFTKSEALDCK